MPANEGTNFLRQAGNIKINPTAVLPRKSVPEAGQYKHKKTACKTGGS